MAPIKRTTTGLTNPSRWLRPSDGRIRIGEDKLTELDERHLPEVRLHHLGFIFQDFNFLSALTCLDNVALVGQLNGMSRQQSRQRATELLEHWG